MLQWDQKASVFVTLKIPTLVLQFLVSVRVCTVVEYHSGRLRAYSHILDSGEGAWQWQTLFLVLQGIYYCHKIFKEWGQNMREGIVPYNFIYTVVVKMYHFNHSLIFKVKAGTY